MTHTAGPWNAAGPWVMSPVGMICLVDSTETGKWQSADLKHANARLIAAAPDLLAACKRLVNDSMFKDHPEASQMAIDAIAKAQASVDKRS